MKICLVPKTHMFEQFLQQKSRYRDVGDKWNNITIPWNHSNHQQAFKSFYKSVRKYTHKQDVK